jgi:hypothetical protein
MRGVRSVVAAGCAGAGLLGVTMLPVARAAAVTFAVPSTNVTPNPSAPGSATTFGVSCGSDAKSATLFGTTLGLADLILMHSTASTMAGDFVVTVTLPRNIAPGVYHPAVDCSNGVSGTFTFRVNPVPAQAPQTGDGTTMTATGTVLAPIGFGLIATGALGAVGVWITAALLRRRVPSRD